MIPIKSREYLIPYIEYALSQIKNMGINVRYLQFDRGFSSVSLPIYLQKHGYRYILHFTPNAVTKRMSLKDGESALYNTDGESFKIVRVDDSETNIKYLFATNMNCKSKRVLKRYKQVGAWRHPIESTTNSLQEPHRGTTWCVCCTIQLQSASTTAGAYSMHCKGRKESAASTSSCWR
ncbi:MAG: hypothetical protein ACYC7D_14925 [Nitrososphaerales archaeon]